MNYYRLFLKIIFISLLIGGTITLTNFFASDAIVKKLPVGSRICKLYRKGNWGNGDYVYALKVAMSLENYVNFSKRDRLTSDVVDPFSVIGYTCSIDDIPFEARKDWDEPASPDLKYYVMNRRSFVRASYHDGFLYYFSRGW